LASCVAGRGIRAFGCSTATAASSEGQENDAFGNSGHAKLQGNFHLNSVDNWENNVLGVN
jgi:hypothetical protein